MSHAIKFESRRLLKYHPPASCVLYLPGEGDAYSATIRDISGNGNHGTITGATWDRLPSGLPILNCDGNDSVDCGGGASLQIGLSDYTIMTWVKLTIDQTHFIIGSDITNNPNPLYVNSGTGRIRTALGATGFSPAVPSNNITGQWRHLAISLDRDANADFVINGVSEGTADISAKAAINLAIGHLYIGYSVNPGFALGLIGLSKLFLSALTAASIANHFNQERWMFGV